MKKTSSKAASKKASSKAAKSNKSKTSQGSILGNLKAQVAGLAGRIESVLPTQPKDIVAAVKEDHEGLRNFLSLLKDTDKPMNERRRAYALFSALLKSHTTAEEEVVYTDSEKFTGRELHIKIQEGFVEHHLAEDLMKRIEAAKDPMVWSAHANVLSEIVEHHLKEEERDLLPLIRKKATPTQNMDMLTAYLALREKTQKRVSKRNAGVLR